MILDALPPPPEIPKVICHFTRKKAMLYASLEILDYIMKEYDDDINHFEEIGLNDLTPERLHNLLRDYLGDDYILQDS